MDVRRTLLEVLADIGRPLGSDWSPDRPLELESLEVVLVHEQIEAIFDLRVPAREVTPEAFATLQSLEALVARLAELRP